MRMRSTTCLLVLATSCVLALACGPRTNTGSIDPGSDACSILPADTVGSIQSEKVVQAEPSQSTRGNIFSRRCFYRTENFNRSVDLEVITAVSNRSAIDEFWNKRFHSIHKTEEEEEEEAEREKNQNSPAVDREKEEERAKAAPSPVTGVGDEAFWVSNQLNSTLYVLQNGSVIRVSIGGPDEANAKLERARMMVGKIFATKE